MAGSEVYKPEWSMRGPPQHHCWVVSHRKTAYVVIMMLAPGRAFFLSPLDSNSRRRFANLSSEAKHHGGLGREVGVRVKTVCHLHQHHNAKRTAHPELRSQAQYGHR